MYRYMRRCDNKSRYRFAPFRTTIGYRIEPRYEAGDPSNRYGWSGDSKVRTRLSAYIFVVFAYIFVVFAYNFVVSATIFVVLACGEMQLYPLLV
jgi:hypothetical protein